MSYWAGRHHPLWRLGLTQRPGGNIVVERVLRTKPHPTYEAGDRTGRLPELLPLDYSAFNAAFTGTAAN